MIYFLPTKSAFRGGDQEICVHDFERNKISSTEGQEVVGILGTAPLITDAFERDSRRGIPASYQSILDCGSSTYTYLLHANIFKELTSMSWNQVVLHSVISKLYVFAGRLWHLLYVLPGFGIDVWDV